MVEVSLTPISLYGKVVIHCVWRDLTEAMKIREKEKKYMEELEIFNKLNELIAGTPFEGKSLEEIIKGSE